MDQVPGIVQKFAIGGISAASTLGLPAVIKALHEYWVGGLILLALTLVPAIVHLVKAHWERPTRDGRPRATAVKRKPAFRLQSKDI
jgi:hypothetical protein